MPLAAEYRAGINKQIARYADLDVPLVTEADLMGLPEPVRRFYRHCGFLNREMAFNALTEWGDCGLKVSEGGSWAKVQIGLFNSVPEPFRTAYLRTRLLGLVPLEGYGTYVNGREATGSRVFRWFKIKIPTGRERDESALATLLQEALMVPGYALQPYITWHAMDDRTAQATLRDGDLEVSGTFHFNEAGECTMYETEDRSYVMRDNTSIRVRSSTHFDAYREQDGVRIPSQVRAVWHLASGDFEYYKGEVSRMRFNVREAVEGI